MRPGTPAYTLLLQVLHRRNTVSGKLYKDDPAIMVRGGAWRLAAGG